MRVELGDKTQQLYYDVTRERGDIPCVASCIAGIVIIYISNIGMKLLKHFQMQKLEKNLK